MNATGRATSGKGSLEVVTDVVRTASPTSSRASRRRLARRAPVMAALASVVVASGVFWASGTAGATNIAAEKQQAQDLYNQIQRVGAQVQFLGQKWDLAHLKLEQIKTTIANTKTIVASIENRVSSDDSQLETDAILAYINSGTSASSNPLFTADANAAGATTVYNQVAEGDIGTVIATLKTNKVELTQERGILAAEEAQAQASFTTATNVYRKYLTLQANIQHARAQVEGQISAYYNAIQAAANAASQHAVTVAVQTPQTNSGSAPPPDPLGEAAVQAAESYLGVPYVWGGASRSGVDCSGLVMLAYDAVGIYLPHYSGAQYQDTIPVPLWDIQPGDLLFYGPGGDEHVAMYVGGGQMIEAPETGYTVHITPVRLGYGFAGIGRVRG